MKDTRCYVGHFSNTDELLVAYPNNIKNPKDRENFYAGVGEGVWDWEDKTNEWEETTNISVIDTEACELIEKIEAAYPTAEGMSHSDTHICELLIKIVEFVRRNHK